VRLLEELTEAWRDRAACRDLGPEMFFHERGTSDYEDARQVCASCPVRINCLDYALRCEPVVGGHRLGMWGGLLPRERKRLAATVGRLRSCSECGATFASHSSIAKVCSQECRRSRNNRLGRERHALGVAS
jgi:WhiB family redox-sensing transcriptional regulator